MRHGIVVAAISVSCGSSDYAGPLEKHYTESLAKQWGITATVSCPKLAAKPVKGDTVTCQFTHEGKQVTLTHLFADDSGVGEIRLKSGNAIYVPVVVLERSVAKKDWTKGMKLQCPQRYFVLELGTFAFCELHAGDRVDSYVRVNLTDVATEGWEWHPVDAPAKWLEKELAKMAVTAKVTCTPFQPKPGATTTCTATTSSGETAEARFTLNKGFDGGLTDNRVVLPPVVTRAGVELPIECPKRIVKIGESIRCKLTEGGKPRDIELVAEPDGKVRVVETK